MTERTSSRNDSILMNMEERARRRNALKAEREAKRRAIEEEKLTRVQRMSSEIIFDFGNVEMFCCSIHFQK